MTTGSGGRDEDLPVFDVAAPVDADLTSRSAGPARRGPGPARGAGIAAAALVILVAGIAFGSREADLRSTASPSTAATEVASATGTATLPPQPTEDATVCLPPVPGFYPALSLAVHGSTVAVPALFGHGSRAASQDPDPGWRAPALAAALRVEPLDQLDVRVSSGVCLRSLAVSYVATGALLTSAAELRSGSFLPSIHVATMNGLGAGDWLLRVEASFDTLAGGSGPDLTTVSYFRLVSAGSEAVTDAPNPGPQGTPEVTPTVPCGTGEPAEDIPVLLIVGGRQTVAGATDSLPSPPANADNAPVVQIPFGADLLIGIDGEVCAASWDIELVDPSTGTRSVVSIVANPAADLNRAAQNRWPVQSEGDQLLVARLGFVSGLEITRSWLLHDSRFEAPTAFLTGADGTRFQATAGCGLSAVLKNGYAAADSCGSIGYEPGPEALQVRSFTPVGFDIPGWMLTAWSGRCGSVVTDGGVSTFLDSSGCGLGGAAADANAPLQDPVRFLLPPGDTEVQLQVSAIDADGNRFSDLYYAHVIAR